MVTDEATERANKLPNRKTAVRPKTRSGPGILPPPIISLLQISSKNGYNLFFYHEKTIQQFNQCTRIQCSGIRNELVQLSKCFGSHVDRKGNWDSARGSLNLQKKGKNNSSSKINYRLTIVGHFIEQLMCVLKSPSFQTFQKQLNTLIEEKALNGK